jgi:tetratricopeptide (TPR) repeat protein
LKTYTEAIDDFTHAIQLEPNNTEAYTYRGVAWLRLSNRDKAIKDFNKALELDPLRDEALANRGSYWFTVKEFKKSISDWEKAWSLNPKNPDVAHQLASIFLDCEDSSLRDSTKALAYATSACELTQWNNFGHLRTLAKAYADTSNFPSAVKWIQRALELAPQEEKASCQELLERYKNNKK